MGLHDFEIKLARIRELLRERKADAIVLTSQASFSWLTSGRGFIGIASEAACAKFVISKEKIGLVTNNIEAYRLVNEELKGIPYEEIIFEWFDPDGEQRAIESFLGTTCHIVYESEMPARIAKLKYPLTKTEQIAYSELGKDVAIALEKTCMELTRGMSELQIAGQLAARCISENIEPITNLVAADERIYQYRHPLPTNKKVEKYVMVVIGGRRHGLVASATRLVHFGEIPVELQEKHQVIATIDSLFISTTRPGKRVADIFQQAQKMYDQFGYKDEWRLHHQGGLTGYNPREYRATPISKEKVGMNEAFAWNPSITGVKSEDTILVTNKENIILTESGNFPEVEIDSNGTKVHRPAILQRVW